VIRLQAKRRQLPAASSIKNQASSIPHPAPNPSHLRRFFLKHRPENPQKTNKFVNLQKGKNHGFNHY